MEEPHEEMLERYAPSAMEKPKRVSKWGKTSTNSFSNSPVHRRGLKQVVLGLLLCLILGWGTPFPILG